MEILIGTDEAGYGPNFGPLVVAATAWQVESRAHGAGRREPISGEPASAGVKHTDARTAVLTPPSALPLPHSDTDLYRLLRTAVAKKSSERRIAIADSKALYSPGLGLRQLERGLHAVLHALNQSLTCWSSFIEYCAADPDGHHKTTCWPAGCNHTLPIDAEADELTRCGERFTRTCEATNVRPFVIRAKLIFPAQFNDLIDHHGSKGAALSHITVGLLREVIDSLAPRSSPLDPTPAPSPQPPISVTCDKHGGRNFYAALLQHHFSEHWIEPIHESRAESRYEWGPPESRTRVSFRMNGERFLPTALASMTAKYLRELSMRAFNDFWRTHVPGLKPTAGYPKDAHRFRQDIAVAQRKLGIDGRLVWRNK